MGYCSFVVVYCDDLVSDVGDQVGVIFFVVVGFQYVVGCVVGCQLLVDDLVVVKLVVFDVQIGDGVFVGQC